MMPRRSLNAACRRAAGAVLAAALVATIFATPASAFVGVPDWGRQATNPVPAAVFAEADAEGGARIIVRLVVPDYEPDSALAPAAQAAQRAAIQRTQDELVRAMAGASFTLHRRYEFTPLLAARAGTDALRRLAASPLVDRVFSDARERVNLDDSAKQTSASALAEAGHAGVGKYVAVIDTGVERTHPMLVNRVGWEACFSDDAACPNGEDSDWGEGSAAPCAGSTDCWHGTHVAGIAVGARGGQSGMLDGMAPRARLIAARVFDVDEGDAGAAVSSTIAALEWVYSLRNEADIASVNMSLGGGQYPGHCDDDDSRTDIVNALTTARIAVVASAGNDSYRNNMHAPACIQNVISVGNITKYADWDNDGDREILYASGTNVSATTDMLAPGVNIESSVLMGNTREEGGTSMSAPHVAGVIAQLRSLYPKASSAVGGILSRLRLGIPFTDTRSGGGHQVPMLDAMKAAGVGTFGWSQPFVSVNESAGLLNVTIKTERNEHHSSVRYRTVNRTATGGTDYVSQEGIVSFAPGETSKVVTIPVKQDTVAEIDETFDLSLHTSVNGRVASPSNLARVTIVEDDVEFKTATAAHSPSEGVGWTTFGVQRLGQQNQDATITYTVKPNSATAADVPLVTGSLTFAKGQTYSSQSIQITEDALAEGDEHFEVVLSNPSIGTISQSKTLYTIVENDTGFVIASSSGSSESAGAYPVTIRRVGPAPASTMTAKLTTANGTAAAGSDYAAQSRQISITPSATATSVLIPVTEDAVVENHETFTVQLTELVNAQPGPYTQRTMTIKEDDSQFDLAPRGGSVAENGRSVTIGVTRKGNIDRSESVDYATVMGTASFGLDYTHVEGTLTFSPGAVTRFVVVPVLDDTRVEGDENFQMTIKNPSIARSAVVGRDTQTTTITENDSGFLFASQTADAKELPTPVPASLIVQRTGDLSAAATVKYATATGTAGTSDFPAASATLSFAVGERQKPVSVAVTNDALEEGDETFTVRLSSPSAGVVGERPTVTVTIRDDERGVQFSPLSYKVVERNGTVAVTVKRTGDLANTVSVKYATAASTAVAGGDYQSTSGTLTFAPNETVKTFSVQLMDDTTPEASEQFFVDMSGPSGAAIVGPPRATVTITDNEAAFRFSSATYDVDESGVTATIRVERVGDPTKVVSVSYATSNGSAVSPGDYTPVSGTFTLSNGETSRSFTVRVNDDSVDEVTETVNLTLSNPQGASLASPSTATLRIADNDGRV